MGWTAFHTQLQTLQYQGKSTWAGPFLMHRGVRNDSLISHFSSNLSLKVETNQYSIMAIYRADLCLIMFKRCGIRALIGFDHHKELFVNFQPEINRALVYIRIIDIQARRCGNIDIYPVNLMRWKDHSRQ